MSYKPITQNKLAQLRQKKTIKKEGDLYIHLITKKEKGYEIMYDLYPEIIEKKYHNVEKMTCLNALEKEKLMCNNIIEYKKKNRKRL